MFRWLGRGAALVAMVGLPVAALFTGAGQLVPFLALPLIVLGGPVILRARQFGESDPEADSDDEGGSDEGGGGNRRPDRGPTTPSGPVGALPLDFSRQGSWRHRGHGRQTTADPGHRRHPHPAPAPRPRRVPAGPHTH